VREAVARGTVRDPRPLADDRVRRERGTRSLRPRAVGRTRRSPRGGHGLGSGFRGVAHRRTGSGH
jgi:hypothetical protein